MELLAAYVGAGVDRSSLVGNIILVNDVYEIGITVVLANEQRLQLRGISVDELADRFPDCDVGY